MKVEYVLIQEMEEFIPDKMALCHIIMERVTPGAATEAIRRVKNFLQGNREYTPDEPITLSGTYYKLGNISDEERKDPTTPYVYVACSKASCDNLSFWEETIKGIMKNTLSDVLRKSSDVLDNLSRPCGWAQITYSVQQDIEKVNPPRFLKDTIISFEEFSSVDHL